MNARPDFDIQADEVEIFLQDVDEHLQVMEAGILQLEKAPNPDTLNLAFRAAHTLKAVAASVGHHQMADLTHTLETLFDHMREGRLSPTQAVIDDLLNTVDVLQAQRDEVVGRSSSGADAATILARLRALIEGVAHKDKIEDGTRAEGGTLIAQWNLDPEQMAQVQACLDGGRNVLQVWISAAGAVIPSARLMQAIMALEEVGQIVTQTPPPAALLEGEEDDQVEEMWAVLNTGADREAVEKLLGEVSELAEFQVQPCSLPAAADAPPASRPSDPAARLESRAGEPTVRISVERLDTLMNLVGELVTERTRLEQIEESLQAHFGKNGTLGPLTEMTTHFSRVVDRMQEEVMQARMLPIGSLFDKFPRLVRDLARDAGKQVDLVIKGQATELDRSVIEVIGDPLIHLLRNAIDHGIERPEERMAAGKLPTGTVWLTAKAEEGHIVVTVRDDGRGIDPQLVRQAAVARGLITEDESAQLDDDSAIGLVFQPNLSTAEQVTEVSGRGIGLDVVQAGIKQLSGSVVVETDVHDGTTFCLTLPLTLAIVQTMLVSLGDDVYAIPLTSIVETVYYSDVVISSVRGKPTAHWRDSVLPLVHLRHFFDHPRLSPAPRDGSAQAIVAVAWGRQQVGLVVDRLIGKQEIVIKPLGHIVGNVPGLSGCTILGNGRVALIIDIPSLISTCLQG